MAATGAYRQASEPGAICNDDIDNVVATRRLPALDRIDQLDESGTLKPLSQLLDESNNPARAQQLARGARDQARLGSVIRLTWLNMRMAAVKIGAQTDCG